MKEFDPLMNIRAESSTSPVPLSPASMPDYFSADQPLKVSEPKAAAPDSFLSGFCQHFGLNESAILQQPAEVLDQQICELVSTLLDGVVQLKQHLKQAQHSFNLNTNCYRPVHNNPLDLAVNAKHALEMLLKGRDETFLSITEAVPQAVSQIIQHQLALSAAAEKAAVSLFDRYKPERYSVEGLARTRYGRLKQDALSWRSFVRSRQTTPSVEESFKAAMAESYKQTVGDVG